MSKRNGDMVKKNERSGHGRSPKPSMQIWIHTWLGMVIITHRRGSGDWRVSVMLLILDMSSSLMTTVLTSEAGLK